MSSITRRNPERRFEKKEREKKDINLFEYILRQLECQNKLKRQSIVSYNKYEVH